MQSRCEGMVQRALLALNVPVLIHSDASLTACSSRMQTLLWWQHVGASVAALQSTGNGSGPAESDVLLGMRFAFSSPSCCPSSRPFCPMFRDVMLPELLDAQFLRPLKDYLTDEQPITALRATLQWRQHAVDVKARALTLLCEGRGGGGSDAVDFQLARLTAIRTLLFRSSASLSDAHFLLNTVGAAPAAITALQMTYESLLSSCICVSGCVRM